MLRKTSGLATGTYEYGLQRLSVEYVNEAKEYYIYNGTGNVTQTTAENGSMFLRYTYDPFGNVTSINAPMTVDVDDLNRYTYNGEDYDYNTGLQYLRARYYSTGTGNFISQDTYLGNLLNPLSQNRYTYVHNSPLMFDDPSGRSATAYSDNSTGLVQQVYDDSANTPSTNSTQVNYSKRALDGSARKNTKLSSVVGQAEAYSAYASKVCGTLNLRANGRQQQTKIARSRSTGEHIALSINSGRIVHQESKLASISQILDYVGFIPGVGDMADGINAILYLIQGDYVNAALSAVSVLPIGDFIKIAAKGGDNLLRLLFKHGDEVADVASGIAKTGDEALDVAKMADDVPNASSRIDSTPYAHDNSVYPEKVYGKWDSTSPNDSLPSNKPRLDNSPASTPDNPAPIQSNASTVRRSACDTTTSACFIAGTAILTDEGLVAIEGIEAGDIVIATDTETGETAEKEVVETYVRETDELVHLTINGEKITTTPEHPFYVSEVGWTSAIDLRAGDILVLVNGEYVIVEKTQHEILEEPVNVYNFQVADFHTYYVGEQSVLVHNTCPTGADVGDSGEVTVKTVKPEAAVTGSKKHGVKWKEGPARAKATGNPQGQWAASDLDYATEMANTLQPGESAYFDLPKGAQSVVHMPDGTTLPATKMWVRNNGTGTWHGYPMTDLEGT